MAAATEKELADLHAAVASALKDNLYDEDPETGARRLNKDALNGAIKFLKDNAISAAPSEDTSDLEKKLAERRARRNVHPVDLDAAVRSLQ